MTGKDQRKAGTNGAARRRGRGLRALAATLPKVTGRALGRRGLAESGLIADWPGVVGAELAAITAFRGFTPRVPKEGRERTLTLRVDAGHALVLQHLAPQVIERVNGFLGYRAATHLKLQQGPLGKTDPAPASRPATPDRPVEEALKTRAVAVEDPELRAALERLGRAVDAEITGEDGR